MGDVYKARDTRLNRTVAIKTAKAAFTERFTREARSIAALNHPNIATLYDVGPDYLVMEFVEGEPVKGPLTHEEALSVARQIAEAIEAAHEKGIIHRDLKPGNIVRREDGTVKVTRCRKHGVPCWNAVWRRSRASGCRPLARHACFWKRVCTQSAPHSRFPFRKPGTRDGFRGRLSARLYLGRWLGPIQDPD